MYASSHLEGRWNEEDSFLAISGAGSNGNVNSSLQLFISWPKLILAPVSQFPRDRKQPSFIFHLWFGTVRSGVHTPETKKSSTERDEKSNGKGERTNEENKKDWLNARKFVPCAEEVNFLHGFSAFLDFFPRQFSWNRDSSMGKKVGLWKGSDWGKAVFFVIFC